MFGQPRIIKEEANSQGLQNGTTTEQKYKIRGYNSTFGLTTTRKTAKPVKSVEDEQNSYFSTPGALNIQNDTSSSGAHSTSEKSLPGPSLDDARDARSQNEVSRRYYTSKIVVSNVMSLVPKMCEVSEFILRNQVNYAFITETWIRSSVVDSVIDIPGFSVLRRDRQSDHHGRICLYVKDASYKKLDELSCCP